MELFFLACRQVFTKVFAHFCPMKGIRKLKKNSLMSNRRDVSYCFSARGFETPASLKLWISHFLNGFVWISLAFLVRLLDVHIGIEKVYNSSTSEDVSLDEGKLRAFKVLRRSIWVLKTLASDWNSRQKRFDLFVSSEQQRRKFRCVLWCLINVCRPLNIPLIGRTFLRAFLCLLKAKRL